MSRIAAVVAVALIAGVVTFAVMTLLGGVNPWPPTVVTAAVLATATALAPARRPRAGAGD